jgi:hypothetical protein
MTAFARVITIGRNNAIPKVVRLPIGVGVDGCTISAPVTIQPDEFVCPDCKGFGYDAYADGAADCDRCGGGGIITNDEDEISAVSRCLPAAEPGCFVTVLAKHPTEQPAMPTVVAGLKSPALRLQYLAGLLPSSGMKPAARAAGGLLYPHSAGTDTHSSERVSSLSAFYRPAPSPTHNGAPGTSILDRVVDVLTTIAGIAVFCTIALFFMVLT